MKKPNLILLLLAALVIASCTVTRVVEDPPGSGNVKNVAETDPRVTNTLATVGAVNEATSLVNPWHGLITVLIGAAGGIAEWNRRRKQAQLDAVIAGVESKGSADVKAAIKSVAMSKGVESDLSKSVQKVTGG